MLLHTAFRHPEPVSEGRNDLIHRFVQRGIVDLRKAVRPDPRGMGQAHQPREGSGIGRQMFFGRAEGRQFSADRRRFPDLRHGGKSSRLVRISAAIRDPVQPADRFAEIPRGVVVKPHRKSHGSLRQGEGPPHQQPRLPERVEIVPDVLRPDGFVGHGSCFGDFRMHMPLAPMSKGAQLHKGDKGIPVVPLPEGGNDAPVCLPEGGVRIIRRETASVVGFVICPSDPLPEPGGQIGVLLCPGHVRDKAQDHVDPRLPPVVEAVFLLNRGEVADPLLRLELRPRDIRVDKRKGLRMGIAVLSPHHVSHEGIRGGWIRLPVMPHLRLPPAGEQGEAEEQDRESGQKSFFHQSI